MLYYAKCLLSVSFARVQRRLRSADDLRSDDGLRPAEALRQQADRATLVKVGRAVARADRLACWENRCLVKSVAARFMLQRRRIGSVLCMGLQLKEIEPRAQRAQRALRAEELEQPAKPGMRSKPEKALVAHAWLESGGVFVTPRGDKAFKEIFKL